MSVLAHCVPLICPCADPASGPTTADLEAAYENAKRDNVNVGMLLLTNPNNPLGTIYSNSTVLSAIDWARNKNLQTIVDEIYALSSFRPSPTPFNSILNYDDRRSDVHVIWALSKDFGASGFRCGFLVTKNSELKQALGNVNVFSAVSHPMQLVVADMLGDVKFCEGYLEKSQQALLECYNVVVTRLQKLGLDYIEAYSGMFLWADLRSLMPESSWEGEEAVTQLLFDEAGLLLTPGGAQRNGEPGFFRFCFAWHSRFVLDMATDRLEEAVMNVRDRGWVDLDNEEREDKTVSGLRRRWSSYCGE
jgi:aspartate/methionine/tyrosine aminotransferase